MNHKITKGLTGYAVKYHCPKCNVKLSSSLREAGKKDACPDCGTAFVVPGITELEELERRENDRRAAKIEAKLESAERAKRDRDAKRNEAASTKTQAETVLATLPIKPKPTAQSVLPETRDYVWLQAIRFAVYSVSVAFLLPAVGSVLGFAISIGAGDEERIPDVQSGIFFLVGFILSLSGAAAFGAIAELIGVVMDIQENTLASARANESIAKWIKKNAQANSSPNC